MKLSDTGPAHFDSAERLADAVIARVGKTIVLAMPLGLGKANHVANALFARAVADPSIKGIFTALTLEKPHPGSGWNGVSRFDRRALLRWYPDLAMRRHCRGLPPNIEVDEFFFPGRQPLNVPAAQQAHLGQLHPMRSAPCCAGVNVVGQLVAKRVRKGAARYSLSCNRT